MSRTSAGAVARTAVRKEPSPARAAATAARPARAPSTSRVRGGPNSTRALSSVLGEVADVADPHAAEAGRHAWPGEPRRQGRVVGRERLDAPHEHEVGRGRRNPIAWGSTAVSVATVLLQEVGAQAVELDPLGEHAARAKLVVEAGAGRRPRVASLRRGELEPLADPRVRLTVADVRSRLRLTHDGYDVVISEPSNPWMTVAASLFTAPTVTPRPVDEQREVGQQALRAHVDRPGRRVGLSVDAQGEDPSHLPTDTVVAP